MVEGVATLVVDLGNSETRVETFYGRTQRGNLRKRITLLSNMFGRFKDNQSYSNIMANAEYSEENSRVFKLNDEIYCTGLMQETEFISSVLRPSGRVKKYDAIESKLAICNAFCQGYEDIAYWTQADLSSIDVMWNLTILLPADDMEFGAKKMAELARSISGLDFIMPKLNKEIAIKKVTILPEGYSAFLGTVFEKSGVIRNGYEKVVQPGIKTLIIDIGAGTSDLSIVDGSRLISSSKYSETIGGNNVSSKLSHILKQQGIPRVGISKIMEACETGILKMGVKTFDVHKELNAAKESVADELVNMIKEYQDYTGIQIGDISYILVCGGGSVSKEDDEQMVPIADYIISFLKQLSDGLELLKLPYIEENDKLIKVSPRLLNVIGAGIASEGIM